MTKKTPSNQRNTALEIACVLDGRRHYLIAALAELPSQVFSGFITGRIKPTEAQMERIAKTLGRDVDELFPTTQPQTNK